MLQTKPTVDKPVTVALEEIDKGIITYERLRESIK